MRRLSRKLWDLAHALGHLQEWPATCAFTQLPSLRAFGAAMVQQRCMATHGIAGGPTGSVAVKRFYKQVAVAPAPQGGYEIKLDSRTLRTPAKRPFVLPTRAAAMAVAAEWECQAERIEPHTMPLTSVAATALDQPAARDSVAATMLQYLHTDSALCRAEPGPVAARQQEAFAPVLAWAEREVGAALPVTDSIFGADIPPAALAAVRAYIDGLDAWELAAAEQLAAACKSVTLGLAAARGAVGVEGVLRCARLEEDMQLESWGLVEGGHDLDIADLRARVAAPALFVRLLRPPAALPR